MAEHRIARPDVGAGSDGPRLAGVDRSGQAGPDRLEPAGADRRAQASADRPCLALALLCAAQFMLILDTTIVAVALPSIRADLGFASQADLQYVISLYAATFGGLLILAGRVADLLGRRRVFAAGLLAFAAASLACGLAPTSEALLAGRALQGVGAAMVSPAALSLLTALFAEGEERNRALGAWGSVGGAAGATGLVLGGVLTSAAGWEWLFFINLPIALGCAFAAPRLLPAAAAPEAGRRLDLPGALTITLALGLLIFGLSRSEHTGFGSAATLGLLAGAAALLAAFVAIERRVRRPLVAFRLFRLPGVAGANVAMLLLNAVIASQLFFTTLYAQRVLGLSALETGLAFLTNSALVVVGSTLASRLIGRVGAGVVLAIGLAIIGASALLLSGVSADGTYAADVLPGFTLTGLGLGLAFVSVTVGATSGAGDRDQGLASGVVNTAQQVGFGVGIAAVIASVDGYSAGYLVNAALATFAAVLALALVRDGRRALVMQPQDC